MKLKALKYSLGLLVLWGAMSPLSANEWHDGANGIKDYGVGPVPVPAPVPIPVHKADWYFRGDVGFGLAGSPEGNEQGLRYGRKSLRGPFALPRGIRDSKDDPLVTIGAGVGYYWNNFFRSDFTAEWRNSNRVNYDGGYQYWRNTANPALVRGEVSDRTAVGGGIFLFNGYYDFYRGEESDWTPYIGGGLGFTWTRVKRTHRTREFDCGMTVGNKCMQSALREEFQTSSKAETVTMAAMATTGFSYRLSDKSLLDFNYRFLYLGGPQIGLNVKGSNFGGTSRVSFDDTFEHQLRAGLRFDIY